MADEPAEVFGMTVRVDPDLPPGVFDLRSGPSCVRAILGDEEARAVARRLAELAAADPVFAAEVDEEVASLAESAPWITYPGDMTGLGPCEVCGTLIAFVPEVPAGRDADPERALWEVGQWRKHTPRRCRAMRRPLCRKMPRNGT